MQLDRRKLEEERVWRRRNWETQLRRVNSMFEDLLRSRIPEALRFEETYEGDKIGSTRSASDQAAAIVQSIIEATGNADLRGLVQCAADLSETEHALVALQRLRAEMPSELREQWETHENDAADQRAETQAATEAAREKDRRERCTKQVHQGGRSVGFRQCTRKGTKLGPDGKRYCGHHAPEGST